MVFTGKADLERFDHKKSVAPLTELTGLGYALLYSKLSPSRANWEL